MPSTLSSPHVRIYLARSTIGLHRCDPSHFTNSLFQLLTRVAGH
jgi:hypothetical protein